MYREMLQGTPPTDKPFRVVMGISFVIGVAFVIWGAEQWVRFQPSLQWPTVPGVILQSEYADLDGIFRASGIAIIINNHIHSAKVTYRYAVDGVAYTSSQLSLSSSDLGGGFHHPATFVETHPAGTHVLVYYEPGNPQNAVLIPGADKVLDRLLMAGGSVVAALSLVIYRRKVRLP